MKRGSLILAVILVNVTQAWAQTGYNVDSLFQYARQCAFNGNKEESRKTLVQILNDHPGYHDARIFLARTLSWEGNFIEARLELQYVLDSSPFNEDACAALVDVELWSDNLNDALRTADQSIEKWPETNDFYYKKAIILIRLDRTNEAEQALRELLLINPNYSDAIIMLNVLQTRKLKYATGITYGLDIFSKNHKPASYLTVSMEQAGKWGSGILRLNYAHRFSLDGLQPEVELYPRLSKSLYGWINYGYAKSSLFPTHRFGFEIFSKIPKRMEVSAGVRYFYFGLNNRVLGYTGSFGYYVKNYWLSFRPVITSERSLITFSSTLMSRKYFKDNDNYLGINLGIGYSPDERRLQTAQGISEDNFNALKSCYGSVIGQKSLSGNYIMYLSATITRQELSSVTQESCWIFSSTTGLKKKF